MAAVQRHNLRPGWLMIVAQLQFSLFVGKKARGRVLHLGRYRVTEFGEMLNAKYDWWASEVKLSRAANCHGGDEPVRPRGWLTTQLTHRR